MELQNGAHVVHDVPEHARPNHLRCGLPHLHRTGAEPARRSVLPRARSLSTRTGPMRSLRFVTAMAALAALAACSTDGGDVVTPTAMEDRVAPVRAAAAKGVDGAYIVVLHSGADARSVAAVAGVSPKFVYTAALDGFAATLNQGQLIALQHNPNVKWIEQDQVVEVSTTQTGAIWGLDRIDQRDLPLNSTYSYTPTGAGVRAYVIDTGIYTGHNEFGG